MAKKKSSSNVDTKELLINFKERIEDIETWYLYQAKKNKDEKMVKHWSKILADYKSWVHMLTSGQAFTVETVKIDKPVKKKATKKVAKRKTK